MTSLTDALDRLAAGSEWAEDWPDVLRRAGQNGRRFVSPRHVPRRRLPRRRTVLAAVVVLAIIAPLTALAANHWWFLQASGLPRPTHKPVVVTRGSWSGHRWTLAAYPSYPSAKGYGLCWGVTFSGHTPPPNGGGYGAGVIPHRAADGFGCGSLVGIRNRHLVADLEQATGSPMPTVAFEWRGSGAAGYPSWISGVVVASATQVVLRWSRCTPGSTCQTAPIAKARAETFPARVAGYHARLFAVPLPKQFSPFDGNFSITGVGHGRVVACSSSQVTRSGYSPLSSCKP